MGIFTKPYAKWYRLDEMILHYWFNIKCAYQRATKGYCVGDLCMMDNWFFGIMPNMLSDFIEQQYGYPTDLTEKEWKDVIAKMIFLANEVNIEKCSYKNKYEDTFTVSYDKEELDNAKYFTMFCAYPTEQDKINHELYDKEAHKIAQYRHKCQDEFMDLFKKYINHLWG